MRTSLPAAFNALRLAAGELLPALHDDIAVRRIDLHQERMPIRLLAADQRRTATAEEVEHVLTRTR